MQDVDNIIYIFKKCYDAGYWDQIITLWNPLEKFLSDINEIKKLKILTLSIDTAPNVNNIQKIFIVYMGFVLLFWSGLFFSGLKTGIWNYLYGLLWNMIPFVGGFIGILLSRLWGLFHTNIGKAIFFISAGVFSWGSGNMVWLYYNFSQNIDIPYPSFADVGYIFAGLLWIIGIVYLLLATGVRLTLKYIINRLHYLALPIVLSVFSIYFLIFLLKEILTHILL